MNKKPYPLPHVEAHELARFLRFIDDQAAGECWIFTGSKRRGYGQFRIMRDDHWLVYATHRYAYETFIGEIGAEMDIGHTCKNKACCNPAHLFETTRQETIRYNLPNRRKSK